MMRCKDCNRISERLHLCTTLAAGLRLLVPRHLLKFPHSLTLGLPDEN